MKERLFKPLHWIMLILISLDFIDTSYRITYGYFSGQGVQPPVGDFNVQLSTLDFIVSIVFQLAIAYTIYMLYSMKRSGGYYLVGLNILFVIYGFVIGPFAPYVDVDLDQMKKDVEEARNGLPYVFCDMKKNIGIDTIADFLISEGGL